VVALPPLGATLDGELVSAGRDGSLAHVQELRRETILDVYRRVRPAVLVVELFPFGRKKFAGELLPLLEAAHDAGPGRPVVACSLRDLLVRDRRDQRAHDERASLLANRYFDAILVHADPSFARLEESFRPRTPLGVPVLYTGFVRPLAKPGSGGGERRATVLVSAGGGLVGAPLFAAALEAERLLGPRTGATMRLVAGPFLPEQDWRRLKDAARGRDGVELVRSVPDLRAELRRASASVSQCGYNTALDVLEAGLPALVVPFAEGREDEQLRRARRLEELRAVRVLEPGRLNGRSLATAIDELRSFEPTSPRLDLDGARETARLLAGGTLARPGVAAAAR